MTPRRRSQVNHLDVPAKRNGNAVVHEAARTHTDRVAVALSSEAEDLWVLR